MEDGDEEEEAPYYWEAGGDADVSAATALAHNLHFWGSLALAGEVRAALPSPLLPVAIPGPSSDGSLAWNRRPTQLARTASSACPPALPPPSCPVAHALRLAGVDSVGSVLASTLGLTQSRYQFEIDYAEGQRENIRRQIIARRQRELLQREEARRAVAERAGRPVEGVSAARAASDAYAREVAERAAAGLPEVDEPDAATGGAAVPGSKASRSMPRAGSGRPASKAAEEESV